MPFTPRRDILSKIKQLLKTFAPESKNILYGSQARGDARDDSDFDLLILLPDRYDNKTLAERKIEISGKLYDLSLSLGVNISPLILANKAFYARKTPFTINIQNEGLEL